MEDLRKGCAEFPHQSSATVGALTACIDVAGKKRPVDDTPSAEALDVYSAGIEKAECIFRTMTQVM